MLKLAFVIPGIRRESLSAQLFPTCVLSLGFTSHSFPLVLFLSSTLALFSLIAGSFWVGYGRDMAASTPKLSSSDLLIEERNLIQYLPL